MQAKARQRGWAGSACAHEQRPRTVLTRQAAEWQGAHIALERQRVALQHPLALVGDGFGVAGLVLTVHTAAVRAEGAGTEAHAVPAARRGCRGRSECAHAGAAAWLQPVNALVNSHLQALRTLASATLGRLVQQPAQDGVIKQPTIRLCGGRGGRRSAAGHGHHMWWCRPLPCPAGGRGGGETSPPPRLPMPMGTCHCRHPMHALGSVATQTAWFPARSTCTHLHCHPCAQGLRRSPGPQVARCSTIVARTLKTEAQRLHPRPPGCHACAGHAHSDADCGGTRRAGRSQGRASIGACAWASRSPGAHSNR